MIKCFLFFSGCFLVEAKTLDWPQHTVAVLESRQRTVALVRRFDSVRTKAVDQAYILEECLALCCQIFFLFIIQYKKKNIKNIKYYLKAAQLR